MRPRICRCCGETILRRRRGPSSNPNLCYICAVTFDGLDFQDDLEVFFASEPDSSGTVREDWESLQKEAAAV